VGRNERYEARFLAVAAFIVTVFVWIQWSSEAAALPSLNLNPNDAWICARSRCSTRDDEASDRQPYVESMTTPTPRGPLPLGPPVDSAPAERPHRTRLVGPSRVGGASRSGHPRRRALRQPRPSGTRRPGRLPAHRGRASGHRGRGHRVLPWLAAHHRRHRGDVPDGQLGLRKAALSAVSMGVQRAQSTVTPGRVAVGVHVRRDLQTSCDPERP
jgi:hypothetical protein